MKDSSNHNKLDEIRDVMTAAEAAEYLQIHIKTLYDWIKSGELRVIKLGPRSTRILKQDIVSFLESRASETQKAKEAAENSRLITTRKMKTKINK